MVAIYLHSRAIVLSIDRILQVDHITRQYLFYMPAAIFSIVTGTDFWDLKRKYDCSILLVILIASYGGKKREKNKFIHCHEP